MPGTFSNILCSCCVFDEKPPAPDHGIDYEKRYLC